MKGQFGHPPILPIYKSQIKKPSPRYYENVILLVCSTLVIFFFFFTIYVGSTFIRDHIEDENWSSKIGLPNTKSILKKWSIKNLNGFDITEFGKPPIVKQSEN